MAVGTSPAEDVDLQHPADFLRLDLGDQVGDLDAGIVDEHVEATEGLDGGGSERARHTFSESLGAAGHEGLAAGQVDGGHAAPSQRIPAARRGHISVQTHPVLRT
ncbi:hypothetical protein [Nostocoides jenkinsii]|uniref:hypothetical protein n=1 Tax=Nostocoides jenkinsii TaxID=330834 RepID=UPI00065C13CA|nr:hypothetical protein [Tetrasphaera jenkinsii]